MKITNFTDKIVKCGFPISALDKYLTLLKQTPYNIKIIDSNLNTLYTPNEYKINKRIEEFLRTLSNVDENNLSVKEAYDFIYNIKNTAKDISNTINKNINEVSL